MWCLLYFFEWGLWEAFSSFFEWCFFSFFFAGACFPFSASFFPVALFDSAGLGCDELLEELVELVELAELVAGALGAVAGAGAWAAVEFVVVEAGAGIAGIDAGALPSACS